jgi:hypothetical protein
VDFLALLANRATAARVVSAPAQGATVEPVLELLAVLRFPEALRAYARLVSLDSSWHVAPYSFGKKARLAASAPEIIVMNDAGHQLMRGDQGRTVDALIRNPYRGSYFMPAACWISPNTSSGCETIDAWLESFTVIVVAFMRVANVCWREGGIS